MKRNTIIFINESVYYQVKYTPCYDFVKFVLAWKPKSFLKNENVTFNHIKNVNLIRMHVMKCSCGIKLTIKLTI